MLGCVILFPRLCHAWGVAPLYIVLGIVGFFFGPYIRWEDLPMVLCMDFAHGFGCDGFRSMVFCRFGQGNYDYVLIHGSWMLQHVYICIVTLKGI